MKKSNSGWDVVLAVAMVAVAALSGCAGPAIKHDSAAKSDRAERALVSALRGHRPAKAAGELERMAKASGDDPSMERALLTSLGLVYLQMGDRKDFLDTASRLRGYLDPEAPLVPETQYVLVLSGALTGRPDAPLVGRGADQRLRQAINSLLRSKK